MTKRRMGCMAAIGLGLAGLLVLALLMLYSAHHIGITADYAKSALRAQPPAKLPAPLTLKIVTYNIQDTWVVGRHRPERMRALAAKLAELDPDIVGFQEAIVGDARQILIDGLQKTRLKYSQYYSSGLVGSGLLIVSAYPIKEAYFHRYQAAGDWYKCWEGDWLAGKGVALARIALPDGRGWIDLYNTHSQAGYGNPRYREVRKRQMAELAEFVRNTHIPNAVGFLVGDMNCPPGSEDFQTAVEGARLERVMKVDSRIDHVFGIQDGAYSFTVLDSGELSEHNGIRLSDHNGYETTVQMSSAPGAPDAASRPSG